MANKGYRFGMIEEINRCRQRSVEWDYIMQQHAADDAAKKRDYQIAHHNAVTAYVLDLQASGDIPFKIGEAALVTHFGSVVEVEIIGFSVISATGNVEVHVRLCNGATLHAQLASLRPVEQKEVVNDYSI